MVVLGWLANLFPLWVLLAGTLALFEPSLFTWFRGDAIVIGLAVIMLGMGLTLTLDDFRQVWRLKRAVLIGFVAQYAIMPTLGFFAAQLFALDGALAVGLVLVGSAPGGTASNVVTYLARANVALSVVMTTCSTLAAVIMTPLLTKFWAGTWIEVDASALVLSTLQVVLLPVCIGVLINRYFPRGVELILPIAPLASVLTIALICASVIGQNAAAIRSGGVRLLGAVLFLHSAGFALGFLAARGFGLSTTAQRTISIEVGMQNSGLAVVLAQRHFPGTLAAVPCAISSVVHSLLGSLLAGLWRLGKRVDGETQGDVRRSGSN